MPNLVDRVKIGTFPSSVVSCLLLFFAHFCVYNNTSMYNVQKNIVQVIIFRLECV